MTSRGTPSSCGQELQISVFDEDTFSANDPLGSRTLPVLDLIETNAGQRPLAGTTVNIDWEYMGICFPSYIFLIAQCMYTVYSYLCVCVCFRIFLMCVCVCTFISTVTQECA